MHPLLFYFVLLLVFLLLSLFFSGSETAFMAVDRMRLKYQAEAGDKGAQSIKRILSNPDRLLGVILLGNTITNIAAATLVTYIIATYVPHDYVNAISVFGSFILTLVILIFCELTPKLIAATHAAQVTRKLLWPIRFSLWLLSPFARMGSWVASRLVKLAGLSPEASPFAHALSEEEIRAIIAGSTDSNIAQEKKEMLHNIFQIGATLVREVMIPRGEVTAIDIDTPLEQILSFLQNTPFSRIPAYRKNFENILGIIYVKDLLQHLQKPEGVNVSVLLRPVHFVPDTARIEFVLSRLQSMRLHMAIVVDEFGGVEGIVTLEDILEEIVGEIRDEHDTEAETVRELGPELYSVSGNLPVRDFNRLFEVKIPESKEYATVVGFLQTRTGRLLHEGETVRYKSLTFSIERAEGFKIASVRVRVPEVKAVPESP